MLWSMLPFFRISEMSIVLNCFYKISLDQFALLIQFFYNDISFAKEGMSWAQLSSIWFMCHLTNENAHRNRLLQPRIDFKSEDTEHMLQKMIWFPRNRSQCNDSIAFSQWEEAVILNQQHLFPPFIWFRLWPYPKFIWSF